MTTLFVPAFNEAAHVEAFDAQARRLLALGVVDRVVVADGSSADSTPDLLTALGYGVLHTGATPEADGKGGNVARGLRLLDAPDNEVVVLLDFDVVLLDPERLGALVGAAEAHDGLVKADFRRVGPGGQPIALPGGRVTDLVARPLLAQQTPDLARLGQPLSGQVAARLGVLLSLPMYSHYGLEIGILVAARRRGPVPEASIGRLRNGQRGHRHLERVSTDVVDAWFMEALDIHRPGSRVRLVQPA